MAEEKKKLDVSKVVDSKLTKSEFIDLVVDDISSQLHAELDSIRKRQEELRAVLQKPLPMKDYMHLIEKGYFSVQLYQANEKRVDISFVTGNKAGNSIPISTQELPKEMLETLVERKQLSQRYDEVAGQLNKLGDKAGRLSVLRKLISSTEDGKAVLDLIEGVRLNTQKLLAARK